MSTQILVAGVNIPATPLGLPNPPQEPQPFPKPDIQLPIGDLDLSRVVQAIMDGLQLVMDALQPIASSVGVEPSTLLIGFFFLLVIGIVASRRGKKKVQKQYVPRQIHDSNRPKDIPPRAGMEKYCHNCGTKIIGVAKFCPSCGAAQ